MLQEMIEPPMTEPQRLLSSAIAIKSIDDWERMDEEVTVASCEMGAKIHWNLSFCPWDRCFYVAIDGHERLRTDSPHIACAYFTARCAY